MAHGDISIECFHIIPECPELQCTPSFSQTPNLSQAQCEEKECQKWRKIAVEDVPSDQAERWTCSMHLDPR